MGRAHRLRPSVVLPSGWPVTRSRTPPTDKGTVRRLTQTACSRAGACVRSLRLASRARAGRLQRRAAARDALERLGGDVDRGARLAVREAMRRPIAPDSYPEMRRVLRGRRPRPAPEAGHVRGGPGGVPRAARPVPVRRAAPRVVQLLHAAAAADVDRRRGARRVDQPGRRRVACSRPTAPSSRRRSSRWLRDVPGYGDGAWGVLTSGGVMANIMALTVARDVHLRRAAAAWTARRAAPS